MPFTAFDRYFPEVARAETRTITVLPGSPLGVPAGDYAFLEMYCDEPGCDCRRVMFSVMSSTHKGLVAVIAWGWEDRGFYARWWGRDDPEGVEELKGPVLNLGSPQTRHSKRLLELAQQYLLTDPAYVERIKRHYALFRAEIDGKEGSATSRAPSRPDREQETSRERRARRREARKRWGRDGGSRS